ncbi:MAG: type II toxin-antitoxin system VapC family toxin [Myxococcales bacterium]|nr:type II toxin-antitoxin system VapC family toxin [Myxococcales bacterium]
MRLLLDTHTFLRWDEDTLPRSVRRRIEVADEVFVSAASAWEIAIKSGLGKIVVKAPLGEAILDYGFTALPITFGHADAVRGLPLHHRDPFDRLLIAQAQTESLTVVSRDPAFSAYAVPVVWS